MIPGGEILQPSTLEIDFKVREWRREINRMLPVGKRAIQQPSDNSWKLLGDTLRRLDGMVVGPYLCGDHVTVADCAAFPFLWRLETEDHLSQCPKLQAWLGHCRINPVFHKTVQSSWWWWW
jgi:glutathione S-transferase